MFTVALVYIKGKYKVEFDELLYLGTVMIDLAMWSAVGKMFH